MNEVGVELESESEIVCEAMCAPGPFEEMEKPKILDFNEPFLLFMRKKNAEMPYFLLWIQDGYLLEKENGE